MTSPSSSSDSGLRASDAERERVAETLRRHHLDGRLDTDELQERLERAYAARTTGELAPLLADLPAQPRRPPGRARAGARPAAVRAVRGAAVAPRRGRRPARAGDRRRGRARPPRAAAVRRGVPPAALRVVGPGAAPPPDRLEPACLTAPRSWRFSAASPSSRWRSRDA